MTLTPRDKWAMSLIPSVLVALAYIWVFQGRLAEEVKGQSERLETLKGPAAPAPKAPAKGDLDRLIGEREQLVKQQKALDQSLRDRLSRIREAETQVADDESTFNPVAVAALFGELAERHRVRLLKESEAELGNNRGPAVLLSAVRPWSPRSMPTGNEPLRNGAVSAPSAPPGGTPSLPSQARDTTGTLALPPCKVRHVRLDGHSRNLSRTLTEILERLPRAVPLSAELSINPDPQGQSRLLDLWIVP